MATIPVDRGGRVSPTGAAAFDPRPGQDLRDRAANDLSRAQTSISLGQSIVSGVSQIAQLGQQYFESKQRTANSELNRDLIVVQTALDKTFANSTDPEAPAQYQEEMQAFIDTRHADNPFLGEQSKLQAETFMAKALRGQVNRQVELQRATDIAVFEQRSADLQKQMGSIDPTEAHIAGLIHENLIDEQVEAGLLDEAAGGRKRREATLTAELGRVEVLPTVTAINGIDDGSLLESATPAVKKRARKARIAEDNQIQANARAVRSAQVKADKAKFDNEQDEITLQLDSGLADSGVLDTEFFRANFSKMDRKTRALYTNVQAGLKTAKNDPAVAEAVATHLDNNNLDGARTVLSGALAKKDGAAVTVPTFLSITDHIRTMRGDLTPAQESGVAIIKDGLRPVQGDPSGFMDRIGSANAQREFREWMRQNPTASFDAHEAKADELVVRFQRVAYGKMATAIGVPIELGPIPQNRVTIKLLIEGSLILEGKFNAGDITEDEYDQRDLDYVTWISYVTRMDASLQKENKPSRDRGFQ